MTDLTDEEIISLAQKHGFGMDVMPNEYCDEIGFARGSRYATRNVRTEKFLAFARALLAEQARTEPVAEFSARVSMLLAHAKRGDRVSHDEVLEIAAMDPDELRRRAVVARDWHRAYQKCLDGLPLKAGAHHTVPAGCWFPKDIRMLVEQLLAAQPLKAEQAKDAAEDAELLEWLEEKHYALHPIKEDQGDDTYTLWWQVTDKDKSISGHPLGNIRAAIRAARAAERKA